jgi:(p)ppGpp synthase/HD superfamily hydrolase
MAMKNLVELAEQFCIHYHDGQKRKAGNQEPYSNHPFAVRDILVVNGYDDSETQAIALLHDTIEDTVLGDFKDEIETVFGLTVYEGVYVLSNNTVGKHADRFSPLFESLDVQLTDERRMLTPEAYKLRILFSRNAIKRIKIADMIHNTSSLPDLKPEGIKRKLEDAETFYIPLGRAVAPIMVGKLERNIANYKQSSHYRENFGNN